MQSTTSERRRVPRIHLGGELFKLASNGKVFSIHDLSESGMGIRVLDTEDLFLFPVGRDIHGILSIRGDRLSVKAIVQRINQDVVGCEFRNMDAGAEDHLKKFLDPASLGRELKPIPVAGGSAAGASLWFHGPSGTDLFLWREWDGQYVRMVLCFHGCYVEWQTEAGIKTGVCPVAETGPSERSGVIDFETRLFETDEMLDPVKVKIARELITNAALTADLRKLLQRRLEEKDSP